MKLSPILWGALAVVGVLVLYGQWRNDREDTRVKAWQQTSDSLELAIAVRDMEAAQRDAEVTRYRLMVDSLVAEATPLPPVRATLPPAAPNVGSPSDSAAYWQSYSDRVRMRSDSVQADNAVLRAAVANRDARLVAMGHLLALSEQADSTHTAERDSLRQHIRQAPQGRPRGISLLGVRLCPTVGLGYAANVVGGVVRAGPAVAVVQPLSCGA